MVDARRIYERVGFARAPERDWEVVPSHRAGARVRLPGHQPEHRRDDAGEVADPRDLRRPELRTARRGRAAARRPEWPSGAAASVVSMSFQIAGTQSASGSRTVGFSQRHPRQLAGLGLRGARCCRPPGTSRADRCRPRSPSRPAGPARRPSTSTCSRSSRAVATWSISSSSRWVSRIPAVGTDRVDPDAVELLGGGDQGVRQRARAVRRRRGRRRRKSVPRSTTSSERMSAPTDRRAPRPARPGCRVDRATGRAADRTRYSFGWAAPGSSMPPRRSSFPICDRRCWATSAEIDGGVEKSQLTADRSPGRHQHVPAVKHCRRRDRIRRTL